MATSGSGTLYPNNNAYTVPIEYSWTRDGNGTVSWKAQIYAIGGGTGAYDSSPCWKQFYITGGVGSASRYTGDITDECGSGECTSSCSAYNWHILHQHNDVRNGAITGSFSMPNGGTLYLGWEGERNNGWDSGVLTWGVDPISWTARLYYDANGGTNAPEREKHEGISPSTNSYNFTVTSAQPTRSGYMFLGWATSASATTPTIFAGDTYTVYQNNPSPTIYAVWTKYYRPGERKVSGTWSSTNRSGGACERKVSGTWTEMTTCDGGTGTGDPPSRKTSGTWYNQRKIGAE